MKDYPYQVTLNWAFAGAKVWGCRTKAHAEKLAEDFRAKGLVAKVSAA